MQSRCPPVYNATLLRTITLPSGAQPRYLLCMITLPSCAQSRCPPVYNTALPYTPFSYLATLLYTPVNTPVPTN